MLLEVRTFDWRRLWRSALVLFVVRHSTPDQLTSLGGGVSSAPGNVPKPNAISTHHSIGALFGGGSLTQSIILRGNRGFTLLCTGANCCISQATI
jgi:hypothetical protein